MPGSDRVLRAVVSGPHDSAVAVVTDASTAGQLTRLCTPWLDVGPCPHTGLTSPYTVFGGIEQAAPRRRHTHVFQSPYEPDRTLLVSDDQREVVVDAEPGPWRVLQLLRCVRNLLRWQVMSGHRLFLHGGMVAFGGRGVAFVGGKRSGKTSSILAALTLPGTVFVANDDVIADLQSTAGHGTGWPRTINVRRDTLLALGARMPGLLRVCPRLWHPSNRWGTNWSQLEVGLPPMVWILPRELAAGLNRHIRSGASLDMIVFPQFDSKGGRPCLEPLDERTAASLLTAHLEETAVSYDPFLADWFPRPDVAALDTVARTVARTTPCLRLRQTMSTLQEGAMVVKEQVEALDTRVAKCL